MQFPFARIDSSFRYSFILIKGVDTYSRLIILQLTSTCALSALPRGIFNFAWGTSSIRIVERKVCFIIVRSITEESENIDAYGSDWDHS